MPPMAGLPALPTLPAEMPPTTPPAADESRMENGAFAAPSPAGTDGAGSGGNGSVPAPATQTTGSWDMPPLPDWLNTEE